LFAEGKFMATIQGTSGDDPSLLDGFTGSGDLADEIFGLAGNDFIKMTDDFGDDSVDGGDDDDWISYELYTSGGVTIDLAFEQAEDEFGVVDSIVNVENAVGSDLDDGIFGDVGQNRLVGRDGDDYLEGGLGADELHGGDGFDQAGYLYAAAAVSVSLKTGVTLGDDAAGDTFDSIEALGGSDFSDSLTGDAGANLLQGEGGNDALDGATGADRMMGQNGNDLYRVENSLDIVDELTASSKGNAANGVDTVHSTINFSLVVSSRVFGVLENLTLLNTPNAVTATGNSSDNILTGNNFNNVLIGAGGADSLRGGLGNDTYVLDNGFDSIIDTGGIDTATSTISRSIAGYATVENLTLLNFSTAVTGTGNGLNNVITGNNFNNTLSGGAGNDDLRGGLGSDVFFGGTGVNFLSGQGGSDFFVLNAPLSTANYAVLDDFSNVSGNNDTIRLENAVMTRLAAGPLSAANFFVVSSPPGFGRNPNDPPKPTTPPVSPGGADDFIVYDKTTGMLVYDSNGSSAGGATVIALLINRPTLTVADFVVI
jgi:Ca2+-binding RTX toxin-like protein